MKRKILAAAVVVACGLVAARGEDAKTVYDRDCAKCHGQDGKGQTKMGQKLGAKDYTDAKVQEALTDEAAFKAIKEGLKKDDKTVMKPSEGLSDDDIKGLIAYMRGFKK